MATSLSVNGLQVDFTSVLNMEHAGMVKMFNSLVETRLKGFLEVKCSMFEVSVIEFFANQKVITGTIVSFITNRKMVVTKDVFAEGTKQEEEMKVEYRLLHDIVAKALCSKAGSFDVVTSEKFDLMVAISVDLKMSFILERLVKADLGESVKLHPLKVLNNKSVLTYMKKNHTVVPAGESTKASGDTASGAEGLTKEKVVEKAVEKAMEKRKKEKVVVVVKKPPVVGNQAAPEKSKSRTSSDKDSRPLSQLGAAKQAGVGAKCKLIILSSDLESTMSLPMVQITKKQRTRLMKTMKQTADNQAESNPVPIPEIPAEAEDTSTAAAPEANPEEKVEEIDRTVETIEETKAVNSQEHQAQEEEHQAQTTGREAQEEEHAAKLSPMFQYFVEDAEDSLEHLAHEQHAQEEPAHEAEQADERHAQASSSHSSPSSSSSFYVHSSTLVRNNEDHQGPSPSGLQIVRGAFYQRMDEVVSNVRSSQTTFETSLVHQFTEHQLQIASDLDFVKMQLAELVNHLKEVSDAKKG
ncbi:hypothetical protein F511_34719 [Dorcoceras hygrometricum]|uniref:Uncharacterized protein n=1 Tax=Dorcoceras hygrometricum TaxID=472368 RepID=A0A2Z7BJF3_9LAMI|nr:hypothetical protein F511_34719 [Dorcoceras hygrometricum]